MPEADILKYKVSLIGDGGVGKTSLVKRYIHNAFDERYEKTLGTNVYSKEILLESVPNKNKKVVLQVWDVMGQRVFKSVIKSALSNTNGVILVCDLTNGETLYNLLYWIKIIYNNSRNVSLVFLGNKSDAKNPQFSLPAINGLCQCFGSNAYLTSAKTGHNVEAAFHALASDIYCKKFIPAKDNFTFDLEELKIPQIISVEDKIFTLFCTAVGSLDTGMPILEHIYKELALDFSTPTQEELSAAVEGMKYYLEEYHPKAVAEFERKAKQLLDQRPDDNAPV